MNLRKGISPVIATVIIVAVALAIAIAVVGWIMGIWGAVTGGTEMLRVLPDSNITITDTNATLYLHIRNEGSGTAVIEKVVVGSLAITDTGNIKPSSVPPGDHWIEVTINDVKKANIVTGATYTVKIYTAAGYTYSAVVQVLEKQSST